MQDAGCRMQDARGFIKCAMGYVANCPLPIDYCLIVGQKHARTLSELNQVSVSTIV